MEVVLRDTDRLEVVLKNFRRQVTKAGLFKDLKKGRAYESLSVRHRRKDKAAARRRLKAARSTD